MSAIDSFLNRITMYRLVMLGLGVLAATSILESFFGLLSYTPLELIISLVILLLSARAVNSACALFTKATTTSESAHITALILFFILSPIQSATDALVFFIAAAIAMLSKYLIVYGKKHIFNPAALAAFVLSVAGIGVASWWVATPVLLPMVLVIGFLVLRKLRRFELFWYFFITAFVVFMVCAYMAGTAPLAATTLLLESFPIFYFGAFMLTEPQTMPTLATDRRIFAVLIGILFSVSFVLGPLTATPELALLVGNIFAFAVSMRKRVTLSFHSVSKVSREVYEFVFEPSSPIRFAPGQYLEWTIGHKSPDKRGIRRFFTISSAPHDAFVRLAVRIPVQRSTFKNTLQGFKKGDALTVTGVSGSFTLPKDPNIKILAIAGGIGITPFMSMFRELAARHERRHVTLIYSAATPLDFAFDTELEELKEIIGLQVVYLPTDFSELTNWHGPSGYVTDALLKKEVPDYADRVWYLSGPNAMVQSYVVFAKKLGIRRSHIHTDYFPGF